MNRIITIGREFGSGGRELGRRLAEELKMEYYDREILSQIVERTSFTEQYIRGVEARLPPRCIPSPSGGAFSCRKIKISNKHRRFSESRA